MALWPSAPAAGCWRGTATPCPSPALGRETQQHSTCQQRPRNAFPLLIKASDVRVLMPRGCITPRGGQGLPLRQGQRWKQIPQTLAPRSLPGTGAAGMEKELLALEKRSSCSKKKVQKQDGSALLISPPSMLSEEDLSVVPVGDRTPSAPSGGCRRAPRPYTRLFFPPLGISVRRLGFLHPNRAIKRQSETRGSSSAFLPARRVGFHGGDRG